MKRDVALRIRAKLEGTPLAMASKTSGDQTPVEFSRRWIPSTIDVADLDRCIEDVRHGRVHTINEVAGMFRCGYSTAMRIFEKELGVIRVGIDYRIPETVIQKVLCQIMKSDTVSPHEEAQ